MKRVSWGGVEADYSPEEQEQMSEISAADDRALAWFVHLAKAELDARLVEPGLPLTGGRLSSSQAPSSAQNDERARTDSPRRGGRHRPHDDQVSLLR